MDYIEREAAIIGLAASSLMPHQIDDAADALQLVPAADVVPVRHGRWIPDYDYTEYDFDGSTPLSEPRKFQDGWQCSLCGGYMPSETKFCPNCGALMKDGDEE